MNNKNLLKYNPEKKTDLFHNVWKNNKEFYPCLIIKVLIKLLKN